MMSPARRLNDRHPFEIYLLAALFVSSAPAAVGIADVPGSIAEQMPGWPARLWAISLTVGSLVALVGLAWHRPRFPLVSPTALGLEQVGLTIVGVGSVLYAIAALLTVRLPALVPACSLLAFGLACFAQVWKIHRVLATSRPAP